MSIESSTSFQGAWAVRPLPPLIPEEERDLPESRLEYLKFAVDAAAAGTKYSDFYQWAEREGLTKDHRFFGKLLNAFKTRRYDRQGS